MLYVSIGGLPVTRSPANLSRDDTMFNAVEEFMTTFLSSWTLCLCGREVRQRCQQRI